MGIVKFRLDNVLGDVGSIQSFIALQADEEAELSSSGHVEVNSLATPSVIKTRCLDDVSEAVVPAGCIVRVVALTAKETNVVGSRHPDIKSPSTCGTSAGTSTSVASVKTDTMLDDDWIGRDIAINGPVGVSCMVLQVGNGEVVVAESKTGRDVAVALVEVVIFIAIDVSGVSLVDAYVKGILPLPHVRSEVLPVLT